MKGQKETPPVQPPPRILLSGIHLGWTRHAPPGRTLESEWLAKDNPEANPVTIRTWSCEPGRAALLASLSLLLSTWVPFPIKSLALSAHVSPWTIHFWVWDKSSVSGPGRGLPSCNSSGYKTGPLRNIRVPCWEVIPLVPCWCNKLYSTVLSVLWGMFCNSGFLPLFLITVPIIRIFDFFFLIDSHVILIPQIYYVSVYILSVYLHFLCKNA